jgi:hypothetical protein
VEKNNSKANVVTDLHSLTVASLSAPIYTKKNPQNQNPFSGSSEYCWIYKFFFTPPSESIYWSKKHISPSPQI